MSWVPSIPSCPNIRQIYHQGQQHIQNHEVFYRVAALTVSVALTSLGFLYAFSQACLASIITDNIVRMGQYMVTAPNNNGEFLAHTRAWMALQKEKIALHMTPQQIHFIDKVLLDNAWVTALVITYLSYIGPGFRVLSTEEKLNVLIVGGIGVSALAWVVRELFNACLRRSTSNL